MTLEEKIIDLQREAFRVHYKNLHQGNIVLGVATNLMTALGMEWQGNVAGLCNFGNPDFDERWERSGKEAHAALNRLKEVNESLLEACKEARQFIANAIEFGYCATPEPGTRESKCLDVLDAAISKAEGKVIS